MQCVVAYGFADYEVVRHVLAMEPSFVSSTSSERWEDTRHHKPPPPRDCASPTRCVTCTIPRVAAHTGSEKSPPAGDTAPTMVTDPVLLGLPRHETWTTHTNQFAVSNNTFHHQSKFKLKAAKRPCRRARRKKPDGRRGRRGSPGRQASRPDDPKSHAEPRPSGRSSPPS